MATTFRFTGRDRLLQSLFREPVIIGTVCCTALTLLQTPTPVGMVIYALELATPLFNYALRAARSHTRGERELKIKMLKDLAGDEANIFVTQVVSAHKSDRVFSTKTSKRFDSTANASHKYESVDIDILRQYMSRESMLGKKGYGYNSGRALFGTVMTTRSISWILRRIDKIASQEEKTTLIEYIKTQYKPNFITSSKESKVLYNTLNNTSVSIDNKISAIRTFLMAPGVHRKANDRSFSMLSTIEKGLANNLDLNVEYHSDRGYSHSPRPRR